jgi:hypothetical protein
MWAGEGDDPADKGLGKAYTNAIKTFARLQFLIPQGDDPEADASTDQRSADRAAASAPKIAPAPASSQPTAKPPAPSERPASDAQKRMLNNRAASAGLRTSEFANMILRAGGGEERTWESEAAAADTLRRCIERLPARLVTTVVEGIAATVNDRDPS